MSTAFDSHRNFVSTSIQTPPSPATTGTTLIVSAGTSTIFPAPPFNCVIYPVGVFPNYLNTEVIRVTAVNTGTDTLTIVRTQEGSNARTVVSGDVISMTVTAKNLTDIEGAVNAIAGAGQTISTTSATPPANPTNTAVPAVYYQDGSVPTLYVWSITNQQWVGLITG